MQVVLVMFRDEGKRRSFSITRDVTVVGRREDCDFRIPLGEISRKHCRLIKDGEVLKVEDLGSSNGTYHNGERVQSCELSPGDTLQIGSVAFVVQINGAPVEDDLQPRTAADLKASMPAADDSDRLTALVGDETADDSGAHSAASNGAESNGQATLERAGAPRLHDDDSHDSHDSHTSSNGKSNGKSKGDLNGESNGEFDPMSVLEAEGSGQLPALDDSNLSEDVMIDLAGKSNPGEETK